MLTLQASTAPGQISCCWLMLIARLGSAQRQVSARSASAPTCHAVDAVVHQLCLHPHQGIHSLQTGSAVVQVCRCAGVQVCS